MPIRTCSIAHQSGIDLADNSNDRIEEVSWITIRTTPNRWEAELIQQMLEAQDIPSRIMDLGAPTYLCMGGPSAIQVLHQHRWTALLLLSTPEEDAN